MQEFDRGLGRCHAAKFLCTVCKRVESRVQGSKNFSPAFLEGSTNLRTRVSGTCQERHASKSNGAVEMFFFYATDQSPIVKALSRMDTFTKEAILCKF